MSRNDFRTAAGDLIGELRKRGLPDEVVKNVEGANRMGLGSQMRAFLNEIELPIGEYEQRAMKARHRSAHGVEGAASVEQLVRFGNAYAVLFERVLLRLLDYDGTYIDRTTEGWPERALTEPAGGR